MPEPDLIAAIDESWNDETGNYVLGGYISTRANWELFSAEWVHQLTRIPKINEDKEPAFNLTNMLKSESRKAELPGFYRVIEKHALYAVFVRFNIHDLASARDRLWIPNVPVDFGYLQNPYLFGWKALMDMFHIRRSEFAPRIPKAQTIQFVFDERTEQAGILEEWKKDLASKDPELRIQFFGQPMFQPDHKYLPLQAADFLVGWVRSMFDDGKPLEGPDGFNFPGWVANREDFPILEISFSEEQIFSQIAKLARNILGPSFLIYDSRTGLTVEIEPI